MSTCSKAALTALLLSGSAAVAQVYSVTPIPTLGGLDSFAHGINDAGAVVGYAKNESGQNRAFLFNAGTINDLGTLGGSESQAFAVNSAGQIVGFARTLNGLEHAFRYSVGTMSDLGTLGGSSSYAFAINGVGQVAGGATTINDVGYHAFRYTPPTMTDLGTLGGLLGSSEASGIDDDGSVVGYTTVSFVSQQGFVHRNGMMKLLGTLGGSYSYAQAIKNGVIVGGAFETGDTAFHAVRWSDGTISNLGTLPGLPSSIAYGLNASGLVVGKADAGTSTTERAFLHVGGTMVDLNDLVPTGSGWTLRQARGVNASGQIVGFGGFGGNMRGFRLDLTGKIWANPSGGIFSSAPNWFTPGSPGPLEPSIFPLAATYTVSIPSSAIVGPLAVSRGEVSFSLEPSVTLQVQGAAEVKAAAHLRAVGSGSLEGQSLRIDPGGVFTVMGPRTTWSSLDSGGLLQVAQGEVKLGGIGPAGTTAALEIGGSANAWSARVDIGAQGVVIDYTDNSPLLTVADQVRSGRGAGLWDRNGIVSSLADANSVAVGFAEAHEVFSQFPASFSGRSVDSSAILIRLTRYGDADLSGIADIADFARLAARFNQNSTWSQGDFNYDGRTDIGDFSLLASNFNAAIAIAPKQAHIPEPVALTALGIAWLLLRRNSAEGWLR